jgi:thiol:disulfide interchange protein
MHGTRPARLALTLLLSALAAHSAWAQTDILTGRPLGSLTAAGPGVGEANIVQVVAELRPGQGRQAHLVVTATIEPGWHIFSLTQQPGGPIASQIKLDPSDQFRLLGGFQPDPAPEESVDPLAFPDLPLETHEGTVRFTAPIELSAGAAAPQLVVSGALYAQACSDRCLAPQDYRFTARPAGSAASPPGPGVPSEVVRPRAPSPRAPEIPRPASPEPLSDYARLSAVVEPPPAGQNSPFRLRLRVEPKPGWFIYELGDRDISEVGVPKPTLIALTSTGGLSPRPPRTDAPLLDKQLPGGKQARHYSGPVEFTIDLAAPADARQRKFPLSGVIGFQACSTGGSCDLPKGAKFALVLTPERLERGGVDVPLKKTSFSEVVAAVSISEKPLALGTVLWGAFLGGLILNLMPCVLPVIGLKILSFVQQAGQSRGQILALNLWYSAGVCSVFLVLAALAVLAGQAWGEQFQSTRFNIVMAAVVLVMSLSFLGVWEIPIPGLSGSSKASQLAAQEGPLGAFFKGVLSTVLATPCSGPGLGVVFAYTLTQPPQITYALFACMGLGMACPYLLLGLFPAWVKLLPKPGAWMETFKQVMGFVLLATLLFLFRSIKAEYLQFTLGLLLGLAAACWWIGRVDLNAPAVVRWRAWLQGLLLAGCTGLVAFGLLGPQPEVMRFVDPLFYALAVGLAAWLASWWVGRQVARGTALRLALVWFLALVVPASGSLYLADRLLPRHVLPWDPFTPAKLQQLTGQGKTVLVDFSAEWCLTCKYNLKFAVNTQQVRAAVSKLGVVPLLADWTNGDEGVTTTLRDLGSNSIPVLAVYPADGRPPIVLRDLIQEADVLRALDQAGPSQSAAIRSARRR